MSPVKMKVQGTKPKPTFSKKQQDIITAPFSHLMEVNEGTPRSGKTTAGIFRYAAYLIGTPDKNHLVAGYNQEQAYRLFMDGDGFGLMHIFKEHGRMSHDDHGDHLAIETPTGGKKVYFKGGGKSHSHKAITGMSLGGVAYCEINLLHMDFIQETFRRTFAAAHRYHLADLNPPPPNHPVIKDVFEVQNAKWTHWTIHDNPILTPQRKAEIKKILLKNPYLYKRDWLGQRTIPQGVVYSVWDETRNIIDSLEKDAFPVELYFTADGGQTDATVCIANLVTRHRGREFKLNNIGMYYHSGKDTGQTKAMSIYAKEIKRFIDWAEVKSQRIRSEVFVDPACKSLREELHLLGIQTRAADNNAKDIKGSSKGLEVGIERTQNIITNGQYRIVEHNTDLYDHYFFLQEIGMYMRDDHGKPVDDYNHAMDALRYAVNYFHRRYVR